MSRAKIPSFDFPRKLFGYNPHSVDRSMQQLEHELEELRRELDVATARLEERGRYTAELEGRMQGMEAELEHLRRRRAEVDEISARAQSDALRIIERAQSEAEALVERAQMEIEQLRGEQRRATLRAERRLELVNGFRAAIRRSLHGSMNYVERALVDMKAGLSELDAASLGPATEDTHLLPAPPAGEPQRQPTVQPVAAPAPDPDPAPGLRLVPSAATPMQPPAAVLLPQEDEVAPRTSEPLPVPSRTTAPVSPDELGHEGGPISPTRVVIEAHPIQNYSRLAAFETQLAELDMVTDIYVASYTDSVAELELTLARPLHLVEYLQRRIPEAVRIDGDDPARLRLVLERASDTG